MENNNFLFFEYDIPMILDDISSVAIDTEAMGLSLHRDRLCLVQLHKNDGATYLIHFPKPIFDQSPNLKNILKNPKILKIFHYGRFDMAILIKSFDTKINNVFCTKIASRLARTFTDKHSLKDLCKELLKVNIEKNEQTSDWGGELNQKQLKYAVNDVLYLHQIKDLLQKMLEREDRLDIAQACFDFLPTRAYMDIVAGENFDVFPYKILRS
jgi:ribonuclease D